MESLIPVLTIDGPGGTGKGTVSRLIAHKLGWHLLDSGILYRALAMVAHKHQLGPDNVDALNALARDLDIQFVIEDQTKDSTETNARILLENEDVTEVIRTDRWANPASIIAVIPSVRTALLARQQAFYQAPGLVADGRDMGTVVFPHAFLKIFLNASCEERADRRYAQLKKRGISANLDDILRELQERDMRDASRAVSPLKAAADAVYIDTTQLSVVQVVACVLEELNKRTIPLI